MNEINLHEMCVWIFSATICMKHFLFSEKQGELWPYM